MDDAWGDREWVFWPRLRGSGTVVTRLRAHQSSKIKPGVYGFPVYYRAHMGVSIDSHCYDFPSQN